MFANSTFHSLRALCLSSSAEKVLTSLPSLIIAILSQVASTSEKMCDDSKIVLPRFLLHALQGVEVKEQIFKVDKIGSTVSNFNIGDLRRLRVTIPAISTQKYIVDRLDAFNSLCIDIVAGLPAEITARQKQYEYYREKLLTFKPFVA